MNETSGNLVENNMSAIVQENTESQTCDDSIDNDTDDKWCEKKN